jgi:uncharacterized protein (DUF58 family)
MGFLPASSISAIANWRALWVVGVVGAAAILAAIRVESSPTAVIALFGAMLAIGWMIAATFFTWLCSGHGLVLELPDLHGDFHALSRFRVRIRLGNSNRRWPVLFTTTLIETSTEGRLLPSPPKFLGWIDPRSTAEFVWEITARRRGPLNVVGARVRTAFPGSLGSYEYHFSFVRELLVLPAIYRLDHSALALLIGRRNAGGRLHANSTSIEEFIGVRDYRPGDSPRHVHLALSLRAADYPIQLVVREFEDPSDDDVCVVLDTVISPDESEDVLLRYRHEKSLSFAVALCRLLTEHKYRVRFRAAGSESNRIDLLLDRPTRDLPRLEAQLARLTPATEHRSIWQMLEHESRRSNATVLFLSLREMIEEKRHPRLAVLTVTPDWQTSLVRQVIGQ